MKNLLLTVSIFAVSLTTAAQAASPTIITDFDWGRKVSAETGKPLLIMFYGPW